MKTIKLYGETFEVIHPRKYEVTEQYPSKWDCTDIYQAYDRPSKYKVSIWDYWKHFGLPVDDSQPYHVGIPFITSHTCFRFTVCFNVYDMETREFAGYAIITAEHNRLYLK